MKILHVISGTDPESGGPIEALYRISEMMIRDGHQVAAVSIEDDQDAASRKFPFPINGVGRGTRPYSYNPRLTYWLTENAPRFDVVVLHGLWNYSSLGAWRALRGSAIPYYIFTHGMLDPWFRERYPLKHVAKQIYWKVAEGKVLRDAQAVLFTCEEEKMRARNVFSGHSYKERVVLFGTADPSGDACGQKAAFYGEFPQLQDRRFLLFLSRIHPKKGCDLLIQAFSELISELPPDLDLVIAGPDQVGWIPDLKRLAKKLDIAQRVHWPGMLKGGVKWGAIRTAEAMILPSHQENFGIVIAEAMACSTPVLISNKVNIWREIEASKSGFIEPDTIDGTRNLIRRFMALPKSERMRSSENARAGFLKFFDIEVTARDFECAIGFRS